MSRARRLLLWVVAVLVLFFVGFGAVARVLQLASQHQTVAQSRATGLASIGGAPPMYMAFLRALIPSRGRSVDSAAIQSATGVVGGVPGGTSRDEDKADKSVVRTASLTLIVRKVPDALDQLRHVTLQQQGEIDESRQWVLSEQTREGSLNVRVPFAHLDATMKQFELIALRVTNEQFAATDVTRQYTDEAARMRSLVAEEQQYLQILKQARSVEDILKVTEKLTEVRTEIEQLQTNINNLQHDVAMSAVAISVRQDSPEVTGYGAWHPLINAQRSARSMVEGLADWADSLVAFVIYVPVIALWILTVGAIAFVGWRLLRFFWQRRKSIFGTSSPAAASLP